MRISSFPPTGSQALALLLLALPSSGVAAQQTADRIRTMELSEAVTVLMPNEGSGNTVVFEGSEGVFLVDTMADSIVNEFTAALEALDRGPVRYVVNTHWHQNHLGGNDRFTDRATVVGTEELRERLSRDQTLGFLVEATFPAMPESYWPNELFEESREIEFGGETVHLWHWSGHTDTDVVVFFEEANVAATGDLWAPQGTILPDLDTGGSLRGVDEALSHLIGVVPDDVVIVPGHGPTGTKEQLIRYRDGVRAVLDFVDAQREAGRSLGQIMEGSIPDEVTAFTGPRPGPMIVAAFRSGAEGLLRP